MPLHVSMFYVAYRLGQITLPSFLFSQFHELYLVFSQRRLCGCFIAFLYRNSI